MGEFTTVLVSKETRILINQAHALYITSNPDKKRPSDDMVLNYFLNKVIKDGRKG